MRKMKRFFVVLLSAALLCPMTAYADNSEDTKSSLSPGIRNSEIHYRHERLC